MPHSHAHAIISAVSNRYRKTTCCCCKREVPKPSSRMFFFAFQYRRDGAGPLSGTVLKTFVGPEGYECALLCRECQADRTRAFRRWKLGISLPAFALIAMSLAVNPRNGPLAGIAMLVFLAFCAVSWAFPREKICAGLAWSCIRAEAISGGCPIEIAGLPLCGYGLTTDEYINKECPQ